MFYDPNKDFTCLDGSSTITFNKVNDDYCDCADGTDEPGMTAKHSMALMVSNKLY